MNDIRMEDWYWRHQIKNDREEAERLKASRQRRRHARWMKWARRVLEVEVIVVGFEGLYRLGSLVRGYPSIGGESMALIALAGLAAYQLYRVCR